MTDSLLSIEGFAADGFGSVREAFERAIATDTDTGAALSIWRDGELVVDLAGGRADSGAGLPFGVNTPSVIFSCTKGLASVLVARLVQDGLLDYDAPVVDYWPEYGAAGKSNTRVADALSHRAGLSAPRQDWTTEDLIDWDRATRLLAAQEPLFEPGSAWAYHAITHGWLAGELVRRVTGLLPGEYFERLISGPLAVDAWIGLPAARCGQVATMVVGETLATHVSAQQSDVRAGASVWPVRALTLGGALPLALVGPDEGFNRSDVQAAQIPGAGGISTAHGLAKIWSAVVTETDGVRLLSDETLHRASRVRSEGAPFFDSPAPWPRWGMGFQLDSEARRYLGESSLGHDGAGGQVAFGDPNERIGFAFVTNRMEAVDSRGTDIVAALKEAIS